MPLLVRYNRTSTVLSPLEGTSVDEAFTPEGDIVYSNNSIYFCVVESENPTLVEGITLSVYRREYDGSFVEIGTGIVNTKNTFITDPHPSLDFARYRVVAIDDATGAVSFTDLPGYVIGEKAVINNGMRNGLNSTQLMKMKWKLHHGLVRY